MYPNVHCNTRTWKQPRCLLTDGRIKELWCVYTVGYYSVIKRNAFEAAVTRRMNLEHIMQNEVGQKEKNKLSFINTHTWNIERWH